MKGTKMNRTQSRGKQNKLLQLLCIWNKNFVWLTKIPWKSPPLFSVNNHPKRLISLQNGEILMAMTGMDAISLHCEIIFLNIPVLGFIVHYVLHALKFSYQD